MHKANPGVGLSLRHRTVVLAVLLALFLGPLGAGRSEAAAPSPGPVPTYGHLDPPSQVRVRDVGAAPTRSHQPPRPPRPPRPRDQQAQARAKQAAASRPGGRRSGLVAPAAAPAPGAQELSAFPLMSLAGQNALFSDQAVQPPDTQLAAGPTQLVEMDNDLMSIWSRSGTRLATADLNSLFQVSPGFVFTDPRLLYDQQSGRWFASGAGLDQGGDTEVYLLVSASSDASGAWSRYLLASNRGVQADQPRLGVSDDKVVVSANDFGAGGSFLGTATQVLPKAALVGGIAPAVARFGPDPSLFGLTPSQSLTGSTTLWMACLKSGRLAVIAVGGVPGLGAVSWQETDLQIAPTAVPPNAVQPSGPQIDTGDDRLLSAVWRQGVLWAGGDDACLPGGETVTRACLRLFQVATTGSTGTPSLMHDFDIAQPGTYLYYPAVVTDGYGDLFTAYSASSAQMYPSLLGVDQLVNSPNALGSAVPIQPGQGPYVPGTSSPQRWGDYSSAAADPLDPADVWLAGEYAATASDPRNWGTAAGRLAIQPQIDGVTPSAGPIAGGQRVTVTGAYIQPGATVSFGAAAAGAGVVAGQSAVSATTPAPAAAGVADVAVINPDGAWASAAGAYSYWEPLGGALSAAGGADPAAASWAPGRLDVFARGADDTLWHRYYAGGWSSWESLGGVLTSGPSVVAWAPGRLDVFVRGSDSQLWHRFFASSWSAWEPLGGVLTSGAAVASWAPGRLDVFVRGTDSAVWHAWYAGGWAGWESLGGQLKGGPAAVSWGPGRIDVLGRGGDDSVQHRWFTGSWSGWESLGGSLTSNPAAASTGAGALDILALGAGNALQRRSFSGAWGPWRTVGGQWASAPSAASQRNSTLDVFERGTDDALWRTTLRSPG